MKYKHEFAISHMPFFLMGCVVALLGLGLVVYGFMHLGEAITISPSLVMFLGAGTWVIAGFMFQGGIEYEAVLATRNTFSVQATRNTFSVPPGKDPWQNDTDPSYSLKDTIFIDELTAKKGKKK